MHLYLRYILLKIIFIISLGFISKSLLSSHNFPYGIKLFSSTAIFYFELILFNEHAAYIQYLRYILLEIFL
jgi:hypothetical protein